MDLPWLGQRAGVSCPLGTSLYRCSTWYSRPLLTEWRPKLRSWERDNSHLDENEWKGRSDFLNALNEIRMQLRQYAGLFADVADVPELIEDGDVKKTTT